MLLIENNGTVTNKYDCNGANICFGPAPSPVPTAPSPSPVPTAPVPSPVPAPVGPSQPEYCLQSTNAITIENIGGINKYVFGGNYGLYGSGTGIFVFTSVPSSHPIAFQNYGKTSTIDYEGQFSV